MPDRDLPFRFELGDHFSSAMARAAAAADTLSAHLDRLHPTALDCATWEPHDWSEWD